MKQTSQILILLMIFTIMLTGCAVSKSDQAEQPKQTEQPTQEKPPENVAPTKTSEKQYKNTPGMQIDPNKQYTAVISTTMGDIKVQLFAKDAPKTVNNFVFLSKEKFYDNIIFHRVIKTFMIQTGDPQGTGVGGPGYTFEDELKNGHTYEPGVIAMANSGPNTNGSQFFIGSGQDVNGLNNIPDYTIFGKVVGGMDVVQKIAATPVKLNPETGEQSIPENPISIKSVTIEEK